VAAGAEDGWEDDDDRPPSRSDLSPSSLKTGAPSAPQLTFTSSFCVSLSNSTSPGSEESSTHQPATGTPANRGEPPVQSAKTVPATVTCCAVAGEATAGVVPAVPVGAGADVDAATGEVPGDADASTRDTARYPSPTAAPADAAHTAPRRSGRLMGQLCAGVG